MEIIQELKKISKHKKIIENYFFMTVLLILNSGFQIIVYPFIIRAVGKEQYGKYVFVTSIIYIFTLFITFGFDMIGAKYIAQNYFSIKRKSIIVSKIFSAKIYLSILSFLVFASLFFIYPNLKVDFILYIICYGMTFVNILFPSWYFQGIQRMKIVTYIQIGFKFLSIPFMLIFIKEYHDLTLFAFIMTCSSLIGAVVAFIYLLYIEKIRIYIYGFNKLKGLYKESLPFVGTSLLIAVKDQGVNIIVGSYLNLSDLAVFDLAKKIVSVVHMLLRSINGAIFPKLIINYNKYAVKKIIKTEMILSTLPITVLILLGRYIVLFMGGYGMENSYFLLIILSFTIFTWLISSAYLELVLIPKGFNNQVMYNQIIAFVVLFSGLMLGLLFYKSSLTIALAIVISGFVEMFYLIIFSKKNRILL